VGFFDCSGIYRIGGMGGHQPPSYRHAGDPVMVTAPLSGKGTGFCRKRMEKETTNLILYLVVPLIFITVRPGGPAGGNR
jgi:hypothetical protein